MQDQKMIFDALTEKDYLEHYGRGHLDGGHSGRYPWGSGNDPMQRTTSFMTRYRQLQKENPNPVYYDAETGKTYTGQTAIARMMNLTSKQFRLELTIATNEERMAKYNRAKQLWDSGMGYSEIARKMGLPRDTSARSLLEPDSANRMKRAQATADFLKEMIEERGMIDVGPGVENQLGISRDKLESAIYLLQREGYENWQSRMPNVTDPTGKHQTTMNVIAPKGTPNSEAYKYGNINFLNTDDYNKFRESVGIQTITDKVSTDNGETYHNKFEFPPSMDISRLQIRYKEDGGKEKDGLIEIRRNCPDLDLKGSTYAQVRILVDGDRYLKGMAIYGDDKDFPDGIDVIFNTNKGKEKTPRQVMKEVKTDADGNIDIENPFGSTIKPSEEGGQYRYLDKNGKEQIGLINKTREEGDWSEWANKVPSQFLSKQSHSLAQRQLKLAILDKKQEYNDILDLENETLKKSYLESFASDCDSASIHLYAAALPRQHHQVILPITSMKDNEVYAPNYENGEKVALIRYPHGGTFEIPILTVNNKQAEAKKILGQNARDCVGINSNVASILSGADFDGDTVMVVPTNSKIKISSREPFAGLKDFDHKTDYGTEKVIDDSGKEHYYNKYGKEVKILKATDTEMGKITNLITDMTIAGATDKEMEKAVKHSMVIIDAAKHKLDYRSSERENDIQLLKDTYQKRIENGVEKRGAATIISRAKGEVNVPKTEGQAKINIKYKRNGELNKDYDPDRPEGVLIFKTASDKKLNYVQVKDPDSGKLLNGYLTDEGIVYNKGEKTKYNKKTGKNEKIFTTVTDEKVYYKQRTEKKHQMELHDDARELISKYHTPIESLYADYANAMKAMANEARKTAYYIKPSKTSPVARKTYKGEVESIDNKIDISSKNAPRERQAQAIANSRIKAKKESNPGMTKSEIKKLSNRELNNARKEVGAGRVEFTLTDKEWEAIQAGAISSNKLTKLFRFADSDDLKERATPKAKKTVTPALISRMENMKNAGRTNAEIAQALGLSVSTINKYVGKENLG